jgi:hypothetical protein
MSILWSTLSDTYGQTRRHLHQIAFFAVSPARQRTVGRMGLRPTPGGFGTPPFQDRVARVDGALLVHEESGNTATQPISTVRAASEFFGGGYEEVWYDGFRDPLAPIDPDSPLVVDEADSHLIGEWFSFAFEILGNLADRGQDDDDVSTPQIWPEHFDAAIELGSADDGRRASYGLSPGDEAHPEPYIYVAAWGDIDRSNPYWNDDAFNGSSLAYAELASSPDPADTALAFFEQGHQILQRG